MRSAMCAASQVPGRGAHCCGYGPYTCTLIKNPMMMMMMMISTIFCYLILDFYDETRIRFSIRDKRLFKIIVVEIMGVDCIRRCKINLPMDRWTLCKECATNIDFFIKFGICPLIWTLGIIKT